MSIAVSGAAIERITPVNTAAGTSVSDFSGSYAAGRASAEISCGEDGSVSIVVRWGSSAWTTAIWTMSGKLDFETMTLEYSDCVKKTETYGDSGELESAEISFENGSGRFVFGVDMKTVTWYDDNSDFGSLEFEKLPDIEP